MEWLLILSAMLSAVTGAFTGAHGPEAQVHQAEPAAVAAGRAVQVAKAVVTELSPAIPAAVAPTRKADPIPRAAPAAAPALAKVRLIE